MIGHSCESADRDYHRRIVERGSYIGFDRIGLLRFQSDEVRADSLVDLIHRGYRAQVLLGQDRFAAMRGRYGREMSASELARMDEQKRKGTWPPPHTDLFTKFFPMMVERRISEAILYGMLDDNPRRFFSGEEPTRTKSI